jgi:hypothetical protein
MAVVAMSADTPPTHLADISASSSNHPRYVLTVCPICGERIVDDLDAHRYSNDDPVVDHIATHSPADLDLDGPYRFTPMADILIELHGLEAD